MMLRKLLFWAHLVVGVVAGVVILMLCVTGAAIAFEKEAIGFGEAGLRRVEPIPGIKPLSVDAMLRRAELDRPGKKPTSLAVSFDPGQAVVLSYGRYESAYMNPYTGAMVDPGAAGTRSLMRVLTDWHRWLGRDDQGRSVGKAITGAANVAFLFLAISGLILWVPRKWSIESIKSVVHFRWQARGKARDWNWHTVVGFWLSPVLIVLTLTGMVISYRWASDLLHRVAGSPPPPAAAGPGGPAGAGAVTVGKPEVPTQPLTYAALAAIAQQAVPQWDLLTLRLGSNDRRGGGAPSADRGGSARGPREGEGKGEASKGPDNVPAVNFSLRERGALPQYGSVQLWLDPYTGAVLKREGYAEFNSGRKLRMWFRFLHTGEALGMVGKFVAALASLGGAVLVWTGFALAWRRFRSRRENSAVANGPPDALRENL
ncbi:MAG: PepSY domain-containing protein [Verrucomicrobiales bacterium]|nr:PepSY domain-containing protein [Verrucomicrobiales bacterium]